MNPFKLSLATLLVATATVSLTTAGTPETPVGSPRDLQARPAIGLQVDGDRDLVHGRTTAGSPRAKSAMTGLPMSPSGMKCSMGHHTTAETGCCAPMPARKAACCG